MHRGKVDPGVSELPRGNDLSRDHVNRPLDVKFVIYFTKCVIPLKELERVQTVLVDYNQRIN